MQTPDDWYRKEKDPKVGDQIRDVGKVAYGHQIETLTWYAGIPELRNRPALKSQNNGDGKDPQSDERDGTQDDPAESWRDEDTVVEGQYGKFDHS